MQNAIAFIQEIDRLKQILRKTRVIHGERLENSAEHSWHLCVMAMALAPHATQPIDLPKVMKMLTIHDIVEIDAGDVLVYDDAAREAKRTLELAAAERIFGMLPNEVGQEMRELWDEFETQQTPESIFAAALDRAQPILANLNHGGHTWRENGVTYETVVTRNAFMADILPELWAEIKAQLDAGKSQNFFAPNA